MKAVFFKICGNYNQMQIHKNNFCSATYDAATKTVRTEYIGTVNTEAITDLLRKVMAFSGQEKINHMIANLSQMKGTFTGLLPFFEKEFYPTMIKNGLRTYAMAVSNDVFTQFAASQLSKKVGSIDWHAFPNVKDAEAWTESKR